MEWRWRVASARRTLHAVQHGRQRVGTCDKLTTYVHYLTVYHSTIHTERRSTRTQRIARTTNRSYGKLKEGETISLQQKETEVACDAPF